MIIYYVYVHLDPRKSGRYEYGDYCFLYEPFYVGKGKGRRYLQLYKSRSFHFTNKINKIKESGLEPIIIKIREGLTEDESFLLESKLISFIGREDLNEGSLVNFTDGGDGSQGYIHSEENKKEMSKLKGLIFSDIVEEFERRKYTLLSEEKDYKNCYTKLEYKCPKGHMGKISWSHFQQKRNCPKCNGYKILNRDDVILIKMALREFKDISQKELGQLFGVKDNQISRIKTGKCWPHIKLKESLNE